MGKSIEEKYRKLSSIEHVLLRPGRYVGSTKNHTAITWVVEDGKMVQREVTWNPALIKLFDEIISNSVDESKRDGSHLDTIKVNIDGDSGKITIEDNGGIPVVMHKDHEQYVPEMIFSELRAGSNFDDSDETMVTGQNGEGSSLVNVLSSSFQVWTADGKNQFYQKFTDNLHKRSVAKITPSERRYTKIAFVPDYGRLECGLDSDNEAKLIKRVYDVAGCNPELKVSLNGKRISIKSFKDYVKLYTEDFIYDANDNWRVGFAASDSGFRHISFVNGTETTIGGSHIDYVTNQVVTELRAFIEKKHKVKVKPADIRNHITVFIDCDIVNPRYSSQTKEELITEIRDYKTSYEAPKTVVNKILKSDIIQDVLDWVRAKQNAAEQAALRKKQKTLSKKKVASHIPAVGKNREDCILFITEGLSAISNLVNVRNPNVHGGFPLKGKPKNTYGMKPADVLKNEELSNLMAVLGLEFGQPANDLNYGKVVIMSDQDYDGLNIRALLINFFSNWQELFDEGRIAILQTPIVIAKKGNTTKRFYSMEGYMAAVDALEGYSVEYLKGLGSLSLEEYDRAVNNPKYDEVILDAEWDKALKLAFGNDSQLRKDWLLAS